MALTTGNVPTRNEGPTEDRPRKAPNPLREHRPRIRTGKLVPKDSRR